MKTRIRHLPKDFSEEGPKFCYLPKFHYHKQIFDHSQIKSKFKLKRTKNVMIKAPNRFPAHALVIQLGSSQPK